MSWRGANNNDAIVDEARISVMYKKLLPVAQQFKHIPFEFNGHYLGKPTHSKVIVAQRVPLTFEQYCLTRNALMSRATLEATGMASRGVAESRGIYKTSMVESVLSTHRPNFPVMHDFLDLDQNEVGHFNTPVGRSITTSPLRKVQSGLSGADC